MKTDYRAYPPQLAADVEITEQRDGARLSYIAGSAAVGRYLLLGATEHQVVSLLDGDRTVTGVCDEFNRRTGASLAHQTLVKFLAKLDQYGILAGERSAGASAPESPLSQMHYIRFNLFNPDPFFARLIPRLRWIWTTGFFAFSASLMVMTFLLALMNWPEVSGYGRATLGEHYIAIFVAAWLVGVTHEFAHGTTCKAFGGRATEVGMLLVYYFLPALYCNVSGIHLIPTRGQRLWVIAAGIYWQLMVGAFCLLAWFCLAPHTMLSDIAFIVLLGSVLDVFFNTNPLIKLDGYYFLSQALRMPNLMDRSRGYWRGLLKRVLFGERNVEAARYDRRERMIYLVFGLLSFAYNMAFASLIVIYIGEWLVDRLYLLGLALAMGIALLFMRRPIKQTLTATAKLLSNAASSARERGRQHKAWGGARSAKPQDGHGESNQPAERAGLLQSRCLNSFLRDREGRGFKIRRICHISYAICHMKYGISTPENDFATALAERAAANDDQSLSPADAGLNDSSRDVPRVPRFALHPGLHSFARIRGLVEQWLNPLRRTAMEGKMTDNNQTTSRITGQTTAPSTGQQSKPPFWRRRLVPLAIAALLAAVLLMPWSASVGNYGTLIALPSKEAIIRAPESATLVSLRVQPGEQVASGAVIGQMGNFDLEEQLVAVQTELARANAETDRLLGESRTREEAVARAGMQFEQRRLEYNEIETERRQIAARQRTESGAARVMPVSMTTANDSPGAVRLPAALAVLQADVESCRAQVAEATAQRNRVRTLQAQGIMPRSELDAAETRAATLASALAAATERLDAALIEHRRKHAGTTTEMNVAQSDLSAERMQIAKLGGELNGMRQLIGTLDARRDLLARKRAQFELVTLESGAIFGEDLSRKVGQFFQKGAEICRVADARQLLVRLQVPEREIGDVRVGAPVRLKTRSLPDRIFRGVVSKIGGEAEPDQYGQATYRVELTIDNGEGLLRPGMTAFARIDFDRQMVGRILLHKIKQALRPELWML